MRKSPLIAAAREQVEVGLLKCRVAGGIGFIVGSTKNLNRSFEKAPGGLENYTGVIHRFGIDVGETKQSEIIWAVLSSAHDIPPGALTGAYRGLSAEASVGVGLGANAVIGGSAKSIVLQPFSPQPRMASTPPAWHRWSSHNCRNAAFGDPLEI